MAAASALIHWKPHDQYHMRVVSISPNCQKMGKLAPFPENIEQLL